MSFREIGKDTTILERLNEIFVDKDPALNENTICIKVNNFYFFDTTLPLFNRDMSKINGNEISSYYLFKTMLDKRKGDDVMEIYLSPEKGFLAIRTVNGNYWVRKW